MRFLLLVVGLFITSFSTAAEYLPGYESIESPVGNVYYRSAARPSADWVARTLPVSLQHVETTLGRRLGSSIRTVVVTSPHELAQVCKTLRLGEPSEFTQGLAVPAKRLMLLRTNSRPPAHPGDSTPVTLTHELVHLVLHLNAKTRLPRWFDEGLAMWVSYGDLPLPDDAYLSFLARAKGLFTVSTLESQFPETHEATSLAYQQSSLLVSFLVLKCGPDGLTRLLDDLDAGTPFWEAVQAHCGLPRDEVDERFRRWAATRHSLTRALLSIFNVWSVAAILAVLAIVRHRFRRRQSLQRLADSEPPEEDDLPLTDLPSDVSRPES